MAQQDKSIEDIINELQQDLNRELNARLLFERYYRMVNNFFRRQGIPLEDCSDLTQKVFFNVYKGVKNFRQESKFETWLFKIATNIFISEWKRGQANRLDEGYLVPISPTEPDDSGDNHPGVQPKDPRPNPAEVLLNKEKIEKLREALQQLPEQMRYCAQLRWGRDLSYEQIADIMRISINTVKAHLHQARRILKEKLGVYLDEAEV
ncbi:MAG: sigma-70 family RNA polymerase sigma factor [Acidobacteriota bacterium]